MICCTRGVHSFTERVRAQGRTPSTRVLEQRAVPATDEEAAVFALEPGDPLIRIVRVRLVDAEPALVDIVHIPLRLCPALVKSDLSESLHVVLCDHFNLPPLRATDTFEAVAAEGDIARALDVPEGAPLLLMRRLALTHDDQPLELTEEYARPDHCRYRINLVAEPAQIELTPPG